MEGELGKSFVPHLLDLHPQLKLSIIYQIWLSTLVLS